MGELRDKLNPDNLPKGEKFALDTVVLVYFLEQHPRYFATAKKLFQRIESGDINAVISALVFAELLIPAYRANEEKRAETLIYLLSDFPNLQIIPLSVEISAEAARLRAMHDIRTPDAIHAATAINAGARGIITNDRGFLKITKQMDIYLFDASKKIIPCL